MVAVTCCLYVCAHQLLCRLSVSRHILAVVIECFLRFFFFPVPHSFIGLRKCGIRRSALSACSRCEQRTNWLLAKMSLMLDCRPQSGYSVILQKDELLLLHILEEGDGGGCTGCTKKQGNVQVHRRYFAPFLLLLCESAWAYRD